MTTPIEMPSPLKVNAVSFRLARAQQISPAGQGFLQTIERVEPYWVAEYKTPPLSRDQTRILRGFLDQLEGSLYTFLGFDPAFTIPKQYPSGSGFGTPTVTGVSYANSTLSIASFTVGGWLRQGDYISFQDGNPWRLYRVMADAQANGSGAMTVTVKPRPAALGGTRTLRLIRAAAEMKMIGQPPDDADVQEGHRISWKAVQFIDRSS